MTNTTIQHLFQGQMDYVFFFQGLAFLLVVLVCFLLRSDSQQRLPWHWLALFALAQGIAAWLSLVSLNFSGLTYIVTLIEVVQIVSLLFLTEFGRSGMARLKDSDSGLWLISLLFMLTALGGLKGWEGFESDQPLYFWSDRRLVGRCRHIPGRTQAGRERPRRQHYRQYLLGAFCHKHRPLSALCLFFPGFLA